MAMMPTILHCADRVGISPNIIFFLVGCGYNFLIFTATYSSQLFLLKPIVEAAHKQVIIWMDDGLDESIVPLPTPTLAPLELRAS
jgi:hypothetical protein